MTTLHPAAFPARFITILALAGLAAAALWLFLPGGGSETPFAGNGDAALPPSLRVDGDVTVTSESNVVRRLEVPLAVRGEEGIVLTDSGRIHASTVMGLGASAVVPANYSVTWLDGNGDDILDPGEHAVLTVDLPERTTVHPGNPLDLIIRPLDSAPLTIEDVLE